MKPWSLWILAIAITGAACVFHMTRGPYAPVRGTKDVGGALIDFELKKFHLGAGDTEIRMKAATSVEGTLMWRHAGSSGAWTYVRMERQGGELAGWLPRQPSGRSIEYRAVLQNWGERVWLTGPPIQMRFWGGGPGPLLALHIAGLLAALLVASRAGLEAWMAKEPRLDALVKWTAILFLAGGFLTGLAVTWMVRGTVWPGWPVSADWTGAMTLLAAAAWVAALVSVRRGWKIQRVIVLAISMATVGAYFAAHGFHV